MMATSRLVEVFSRKLLGEVPGGLQVDDVVVGKFLALELAGIGNAFARAVGIHGGLLVRVFAVAQVEGFVERETEIGRECGRFSVASRSSRG